MPNQSQKKTRLKLLISYKGTKYKGWQKQKNNLTIQGTIESALKKIFQENISLIGAGRTDTGAHAIGQIAHCDISSSVLKHIPVQKAVNACLPESIRILAAWKAPSHFHALHSAVRKRYIYLLLNKSIQSVFSSKLVYWYPHPINLEQLQNMSQIIKGQHNFKSFQNSGTPVKSSVRTIYSAKWLIARKNILCFLIEGKGFLKQMIRNLVGTQLALMNKDQAVQKLKEILSKKDRTAAFQTAPSCGLYLHKVYYPPNLDRKCKKI